MRSKWRKSFDLFALAVAAAAVAGSCGDQTGPDRALVGRFSLAPSFNTAYAGLVTVDRMRVVLHRQGQAVALDTTVTLDLQSDTVDVSLTVQLAAPSEEFELTLALITPEGDTAFRAGPTTVSAASGASESPVYQLPLEYSGVGADAVRVEIFSGTSSLFFGDTATLAATAFDGNDQPIAGTPVAWHTLDTARVTVLDPGSGRVVGNSVRGDARIVATLLTGPTDTAVIAVQPLASGLAAVSPTDVTGTVGAALSNPLTVQVTAADGLGVANVTVQFAVTGGGGAITPTSVATGPEGMASTRWVLGTGAGAQTVEASGSGLAPVTFTANAQAAGISAATSTVSVSANSVASGASVTATLQGRDDYGNMVTSGGATVVFSTSGGTSSGTFGSTVDNGDGTYVAAFTGALAGTATSVAASVNGTLVGTALPSVTVTPGAPAQLAFTAEPQNTVIGATMPPVEVTLYDAAGNVSTGATGAVTIAIGTNPVQGTLSGTTATAAVAGVASFTDLSIDLEGLGYTFSATSGSLPPTVSASFDIIPGLSGNNTFGHFDDLGDNSSHSQGFLLGSPIVLPQAATLTHLGILARSAGPNVKIGLYSDLAGEPYQLIAEVLSTPLVAGRQEFAVTPVSLPAGTYWFMAVYDILASIGFRTTNPSAVVKYISLPFSNPLPAVFPAPTTYAGQEFNYYIRVTIP